MDRGSSADLDIGSSVVGFDKEVEPLLAVSIRILAGSCRMFAADEAHDGEQNTAMEEGVDLAWLENGFVDLAGIGKGIVEDDEARLEVGSH
jgi:hypothetical protein